MWALMRRRRPRDGARFQRAVGTIFERGHAVEIAVLADNTTRAAADFHWGDIDYTFTTRRCAVELLPPRHHSPDAAELRVRSELIVEENGEATVHGALFATAAAATSAYSVMAGWTLFN